MYKQSVQNIEVAILSLDGIILNLNRMRYNYYNRLCKEHNIQLNKLEFHQQLSNMYDMYNKLPLHNIYESGVLNAKIERELLQYLEYSGVKVKEGIYELIEYFHQKNIKVAIVSTHHTKNAVEYLKLAQLYNKVHFIIGSDSKCIPLPSNQMLEAIKNHFQVETHHILVISSFYALQKAANMSKMNIIHCDDLVNATLEDKQTCYKCVTNAFEVLNTLLFDKFEEETMYSSILGMDQSMSKYELEETYQNLNKKYADDEDLLNIIDQTYQYHISQISHHNIKDASVIKNTSKKFIFNEDEQSIEDNHIEEHIEKNAEHAHDNESNQKIIDDIIDLVHEEPVSHIKQLNKDEEDELSALLKQIQKKDKKDTPPTNDFIEDLTLDLSTDDDDDKESITEDKKEKSDNIFLVLLFELISAMLSSLTIIFIGIVITVALMHQWGKDGIISLIEKAYGIYYSIVATCFSTVFDTLHSFVDFVPTYSSYINENTLFSSQGVEFLNMFIFNTFIIFIIRLLIILKRRIKK